jgi:hypothetical protein
MQTIRHYYYQVGRAFIAACIVTLAIASFLAPADAESPTMVVLSPQRLIIPPTHVHKIACSQAQVVACEKIHCDRTVILGVGSRENSNCSVSGMNACLAPCGG